MEVQCSYCKVFGHPVELCQAPDYATGLVKPHRSQFHNQPSEWIGKPWLYSRRSGADDDGDNYDDAGSYKVIITGLEKANPIKLPNQNNKQVCYTSPPNLSPALHALSVKTTHDLLLALLAWICAPSPFRVDLFLSTRQMTSATCPQPMELFSSKLRKRGHSTAGVSSATPPAAGTTTTSGGAQLGQAQWRAGADTPTGRNSSAAHDGSARPAPPAPARPRRPNPFHHLPTPLPASIQRTPSIPVSVKCG
jgi:hypothetical protein